MENNPVISDIASSGGDFALSLKRLFGKVRVEHEAGAVLSLLKRSPKD